MTMRLTALALGLALCAQAAVAADAPPSAHSLELARRLALDQMAGLSSTEVMGLQSQSMAKLFHLTPSPARAAAFQQAAAENQADVDALQEKLIVATAATLTDEEISAWIGFLESPAGRAYERKRLTAWLAPPDLTPEESAAWRAFKDSPSGRSALAKNSQLLATVLQPMTQLSVKLGSRAAAIYCQQTGDCPTAAATAAPSGSAPSTARP